MSDDKIKVCDSCEPITPVIFTMAFPYAEIWCPRCGAASGIFDGGTRKVESTPMLIAQKRGIEFFARDYLSAVAMNFGAKTKIGGEYVSITHLPEPIFLKIKDTAQNGWEATIIDDFVLKDLKEDSYT